MNYPTGCTIWTPTPTEEQAQGRGRVRMGDRRGRGYGHYFSFDAGELASALERARKCVDCVGEPVIEYYAGRE